jgi:hypothetical protein
LGDEGGEQSSIIIRFPDGRKDKKDVPSSSKFKVENIYRYREPILRSRITTPAL